MEDEGPPKVRNRIGLVLGPALFGLILLLPGPEGLGTAGWRTMALAVLMATWWITEAVPLAVTALLPLPAAPVLGIASVDGAAAPFGNPVIFLFLGGFLLAIGVERWRLHERIAYRTALVVGTSGPAVVGGFMLATAVVSMWISNSAAALLMLPMGKSILDLANADMPRRTAFSRALMLGIAYAATLGGVATLIGTPPNALLAAYADSQFGDGIRFIEWLVVGVPFAALGLLVIWFLLTRVIFRVPSGDVVGGRDLIAGRLVDLGPMTQAERRVGLVFLLAAFLWVAAPLYEDVVVLGDAGVAVLAAVALFIVPSGAGGPLLVWREAIKVPWGVLLLFGGGLSLAALLDRNGVAAWLGARMAGLDALPVVLLVFALTLVVTFLSEIMSNTALAATMLPVVAALATAVGVDPMLLLVPATLAASCAFMLPVGTPPNAVAYATGAIEAPQMARAGLVLNLVFAGLITLHAFTLARWFL